jgi:hypothetical protein
MKELPPDKRSVEKRHGAKFRRLEDGEPNAACRNCGQPFVSISGPIRKAAELLCDDCIKAASRAASAPPRSGQLIPKP